MTGTMLERHLLCPLPLCVDFSDAYLGMSCGNHEISLLQARVSQELWSGGDGSGGGSQVSLAVHSISSYIKVSSTDCSPLCGVLHLTVRYNLYTVASTSNCRHST